MKFMPAWSYFTGNARFTLTVILLSILVLGFSQAQAKSYRVEEIQIEAELRPEGLLVIEETITYRFRGKFSFAFRDIPTERGIHLQELRVLEGERSYQLSSAESPGTFKVDPFVDHTRITWFYRARNERRSFTASTATSVCRYRAVPPARAIESTVSRPPSSYERICTRIMG